MNKIDFNAPVQRKKSVLWQVAGGWLTNVILIIQGFLLIPLYLYYLGDRLYGFWLATGGVLAWLAMADLGASAVTLQRCAAAYGKSDFKSVISYFWHGLLVLIAVLLVIILAIMLLSSRLVHWLHVDSEFVHSITICFMIAGAGVVMRMTNDFLGNFAISLQRSQIPAAAQSLGDLLGLIGIVIGLTLLDLGIYALMVGVLLRSLFPLTVNLWHTVRILASIDEPIIWSKSTFLDYIKTTPAVLAAKSSSQFSRNLPAVLLTRYIGPEATVAYNISMRIIQVGQGFINQALGGLYAACSHFFHDAAVSVDKERDLLAKLVRGFLVASVIGGTLYALFNQGFVILWTSESQFAGQLFTSLYALASFFFLRGNLYVGMGMALGKIQTFELIQSVEYLIQAVLLVVAIKLWGVVGIPYAIILSSLFAQIAYQRSLVGARAAVANALAPLAWIWVPLVLLHTIIYFSAGYFRISSWPLFILFAGLTTVPFALAFLFGMPDLYKQIMAQVVKATGRFRLMRPIKVNGEVK